MSLKMPEKNRNSILWYGVLGVVLVSAVIYSNVRVYLLSSKVDSLTQNIETLSTNLSSTTEQLQKSIANNHDALATQINQAQQNVGSIKQQLGNFQYQVGNITGTVSTLQKLSTIDPELLKKYSKVYFLSDNYVPAHLTQIPLQFQYSDKKQLLIYTDVLPELENMIQDASTSGVKIYVDSAYRSFAEQRSLKGIYSVTYGAGTANSFSADQGYSEHQLGTAVDLITPGLGGSLDGFDKTNAYQWMLNNGYKYGFVISYPKNNGYYIFEPWHWRFVGTKLANDLHNQGINFYDMDQRVIDTYLATIFG